MIIIHLITFLLIVFLISLSISGYGKIINYKKNNNIFLDLFLGLIMVTFILSFYHLFFKINFLFSISIFILGLIIFFVKCYNLFFNIFQKKNILSLIIIFLYLPMFLSQKFHEDFGYYHLPYALGLIEEKIVFGFANIDKSYVYNSVWLNLYSIFFINNKNFDFLTLPSFILFLTFILFSINQIIFNKKKLISDYYLVTILFYFILKFTRISEFGVDLPAIIFSILAIYYFIKFSEESRQKKKKYFFFLILFFSVFSILIKLSTLPIIFLPFLVFIKNFKLLSRILFSLRFLFIYLFVIIFIIQQFIYSGCIFFPTNFTCLNVAWFNPDYLKLSNYLELVNKSYFHEAKNIFSTDEYLSNFNWIYFWFKRNFIEILEHCLTIIIPLFLFTIFSINRNKIDNDFKDKSTLYIFLFIGLVFWLNFSPVYRFAIHLFATLYFILCLKIFTLKQFSKKKFVIFLIVFIFFSFSKNVVRLTKLDDIYLGTQKINNGYIIDKINSNEFAKIYKPDVKKNSNNGWQGRLCWDIPFVCSYNNLKINKKNGYLIISNLKQ